MSALNHENRVTHLFIAKGITRTSSVTPNTLANGEVAFFSRGGSKTLGGVSATNPSSAESTGFVIMQGRGANPKLKSPVIKPRLIRRITGTEYAAAAEQIDYVGYNTSTGSIDAINDNIYILRILMQGVSSLAHSQYRIIDIPFKSDSSATQVEIANGLAVTADKTIARTPDQPISVERVTNSTTSAATTGTLAVVKGSKYVTASVDIDNGGLVVGDYLVISGVAYKVVALDTTNQVATLDTTYQGASNTAIADASVSFITAANAAAGNWGLKLTGRVVPFAAGTFPYRKVRFQTTLVEDFGNTTLTKSQGASEGQGEFEAVAELEWFVQGNENVNSYLSNANGPVTARRADADDTNSYNYGLITIEYDIETEGTLNGSLRSPATVVIALERAASDFTGKTNIEKSAGNNTTSVIDAINSLVVTTLGGTALTNAGLY